MARQRIVCTSCESKIAVQSFCPNCGVPTPYCSAQERIVWDMGQWESSRPSDARKRDTAVATREIAPARPAIHQVPAQPAARPAAHQTSSPAARPQPASSPAPQRRYVTPAASAPAIAQPTYQAPVATRPAAVRPAPALPRPAQGARPAVSLAHTQANAGATALATMVEIEPLEIEQPERADQRGGTNPEPRPAARPAARSTSVVPRPVRRDPSEDARRAAAAEAEQVAREAAQARPAEPMSASAAIASNVIRARRARTAERDATAALETAEVAEETQHQAVVSRREMKEARKRAEAADRAAAEDARRAEHEAAEEAKRAERAAATEAKQAERLAAENAKRVAAEAKVADRAARTDAKAAARAAKTQAEQAAALAKKQDAQALRDAKARAKESGVRLSRRDRRVERMGRTLALRPGETITLTVDGRSGLARATLIVTRYRVAVVWRSRRTRARWIPLEEVTELNTAWRGAPTIHVEATIEHLTFSNRSKAEMGELAALLEAEVRAARGAGGQRHEASITQEWCDRAGQTSDDSLGRIRLWIRRHPIFTITWLFAVGVVSFLTSTGRMQ